MSWKLSKVQAVLMPTSDSPRRLGHVLRGPVLRRQLVLSKNLKPFHVYYPTTLSGDKYKVLAISNWQEPFDLVVSTHQIAVN